MIEICRPLNAIITGMVVVAGGLLSGDFGLHVPSILILAAISSAMIAAGGNVVNDVYDVSIDSINRPDRPIPSGRIRILPAAIWSVTLFASGTALAFSLKAELGLIALLVVVLLWIYSARWKKMPLIGNVVVAACGGLAFLFGGVAVDNLAGGLIPAVFAFLIHLGREIVKDGEDVDGDRQAGARTLPLVLGMRKSQNIAAAVLLLLTAITPLPYITGWLGKYYLYTVMAGVDIPLLLIVYFLLQNIGRNSLHRISQALKVVMLLGLLGLFAGKY